MNILLHKHLYYSKQLKQCSVKYGESHQIYMNPNSHIHLIDLYT